jgi:hypothetical protein
MAIRIRVRSAVEQVLLQRCMYLFGGVLALIVSVLLLEPSPRARVVVYAANLLLDVAAVATVARSRKALLIAAALAVPAMAFQTGALGTDELTRPLAGPALTAALYAVTIAYVLRYVFRTDVMTGDKFYGAAAGYLMLGLFYASLYVIVERLHPGAFAAAAPLAFADLLYFSFTTLTSTGFGDIVPVIRQARALVVLEQITGALFLAILIARLTGVYPPRRSSPAP